MHIGIDLDNTILDATSSHLHYFNIASGQYKTPNDVRKCQKCISNYLTR